MELPVAIHRDAVKLSFPQTETGRAIGVAANAIERTTARKPLRNPWLGCGACVSNGWRSAATGDGAASAAQEQAGGFPALGGGGRGVGARLLGKRLRADGRQFRCGCDFRRAARPSREAGFFTSVVVELVCPSRTALPARPAGMESATDKSLVDPTAKAVAPLVAQ
jgi:hypothetical protein